MTINIGIDIGGNHTGIGIVNENGQIIQSDILNYNNHAIEVNAIFEFINQFIHSHQEYEIQSIGVGVPGIVTGSTIHYTCNLPLGHIDVKDYMRSNIPIYLSNDVNCAAIAEYDIVDHNFYSNYALVAIGTGIGAGIIINGKLYSGISNSAGEIGHMVIEKDGLPCRCGRRGCFEQYASCTALKKMTHLDSLKEIFYLSETNEVIANVLDEYINNLAEGLANFINLFDVEMLVIGGGLSRFGEHILPKLKSKISEKICNKYTYDLNLKVAKLRNDAGIIGASLLGKYTHLEET